jgi:hypothetical protein
MTGESLQRWFFRALAIALGAFGAYMLLPAVVEDFTGSSAHGHHGWLLVVANIIWFGLVAVVAWLAMLSWRRAISN